MTGREALGAVRVVWVPLSPKNRSCPPTGGPGGRVRRRPRPVDEVAPSSTSTEGRTQSPRGHGHARCSFFVGGVVGPKAARPPPTYLLCTQVLRRTCSSYENARFYPTCARYFPSCHSLSDIFHIGSLQAQRAAQRDGGMIFGSCKASQSPVYPIGDAILAVNHVSCPSLSSSGPPPMG